MSHRNTPTPSNPIAGPEPAGQANQATAHGSLPAHIPELIGSGPLGPLPDRSGTIFASFLDRALRTRHMTQKELAERCGFMPSLLTRYRKGDAVPSDDKCRAIAQVLGLPTLVVMYYAGIVSERDLAITLDASGRHKRITLLHDPDGHAGSLPVPTSDLEADPVERAKHAIMTIPPHLLSEEAKWNLLTLLEIHTAAAEIARHLPGGLTTAPVRTRE